MRLTTNPLAIALIATTLIACVGEVGGGGSTRGRDDDDSDTDRDRDTDSGACEEMTTPVTIQSTADLDKLPKGCWDLFAKLTVSGSQITSLTKLGELKAVNELELTGTALTTIDRPIQVFGSVTVTNNPSLRDLKGLTITRDEMIPLAITIQGNTALTSLDGVADVTIIDENLTVTGNPKLTTAAFTKLTRVEQDVRITDNAALTRIDLSQLRVVGPLEIINNIALTTLSGLSATIISGNVIVRGNRQLTALGMMGSLSAIEGSLTIDDNDLLTNIGAFTTSMHYVTGAVTITGNAALTDLGQVSRFFGIGAIAITDNPNLSACRAVEVAECVPTQGTITIRNNRSASNCNFWCN